mmetsp:Transcript_36969/g.104348  ORF Transcript_36969/g.104348 Transcript_36969/m.104348 type:complete len:235 (-) Transcript_36969:45-749(-)
MVIRSVGVSVSCLSEAGRPRLRSRDSARFLTDSSLASVSSSRRDSTSRSSASLASWAGRRFSSSSFTRLWICSAFSTPAVRNQSSRCFFISCRLRSMLSSSSRSACRELRDSAIFASRSSSADSRCLICSASASRSSFSPAASFPSGSTSLATVSPSEGSAASPSPGEPICSRLSGGGTAPPWLSSSPSPLSLPVPATCPPSVVAAALLPPVRSWRLSGALCSAALPAVGVASV